MILREIFYFDKNTLESGDNKGYSPKDDQSIVSKDDTRKTRLTLRQINRARKASELHTEEKAKEMDFVRQMYGIAGQAAAAAAGAHVPLLGRVRGCLAVALVPTSTPCPSRRPWPWTARWQQQNREQTFCSSRQPAWAYSTEQSALVCRNRSPDL